MLSLRYPMLRVTISVTRYGSGLDAARAPLTATPPLPMTSRSGQKTTGSGSRGPALAALDQGQPSSLSSSASPTSRASAGCILRAPGRPVDLDRYALREGSRFDQVKRNVRAGVGEQPRALAEDHGTMSRVISLTRSFSSSHRVRAAVSLHHSIDGDLRHGRQFHDRGSLLLGAPLVAASHPCYEHLRPDPTPPPGFPSRPFWYAGCSDPAARRFGATALHFLMRARFGRALGSDRSRSPSSR